jgi:predicted dehydrogenase
MERAQTFAEQFGAPRAYASYADLVADPEVQVVYVATVNSTHHDIAALALRAGKAVLLEKPFTLDQAEAADLAALAARHGTFLMEAMWTRFLPHIVELRRLVQTGRIGQPLFGRADFGFHQAYDPASRLYSPALGGGALLDVGIYPISWAVNLLGLPSGLSARAQLAPSGVDSQVSAILDYGAGGAQVLVNASVGVTTPQDAWICGTEGMIQVTSPWWRPASLVIHSGDQVETWPQSAVPAQAAGYEYQIAEVARRVSAGELESPVMPVAESVAIMGLLDTIRQDCGIVLSPSS